MPACDDVPTAHQLTEARVPGCSVAVATPGSLQTWAVGRRADGRPLDADTPMQIGSTSKLFAALVALGVVADGHLGVDDDLAAVIRSGDDGWQPPDGVSTSIRSVLSHTTGLGVHGFLGYPSAAAMPCRDDALAGRGNSPAVTMEHEPGHYAYSGGAYEWMAAALERCTGHSYGALLRTRVLEPAGLRSTFLAEAIGGTVDHATVSRGAIDGVLIANDGFQYHPEHAAAGVWSTAADVARLLLELYRARTGRSALLPRELAQLMVTPTGVIDPVTDEQVGLGCFLTSDLDGRRWYRHGGRTLRFCSTNLAAVDEPLAVAVLTNGFPGGTAVGQAVCEALAGW